MPGFAGGANDLAALTDHEIVLLGNYLLQHYGRPDVFITTEQVAEVRRGGPSSSLITIARMGVAAVVIALLWVLSVIFVRTRRGRGKS